MIWWQENITGLFSVPRHPYRPIRFAV